MADAAVATTEVQLVDRRTARDAAAIVLRPWHRSEDRLPPSQLGAQVSEQFHPARPSLA